MTTFEWIVSVYCVLNSMYVPFALHRDRQFIKRDRKYLAIREAEFEWENIQRSMQKLKETRNKS